MAGHRAGEAYVEVLTVCLRASESGEAVFPISDSIYFEISKIGPYRQRLHLCEVIETMSRFMVVTSRSVVSTHEIESLLDRIAGPTPKPINSMDYLDSVVARSLGMGVAFTVGSSSSGGERTRRVGTAHAAAH